MVALGKGDYVPFLYNGVNDAGVAQLVSMFTEEGVIGHGTFASDEDVKMAANALGQKDMVLVKHASMPGKLIMINPVLESEKVLVRKLREAVQQKAGTDGEESYNEHGQMVTVRSQDKISKWTIDWSKGGFGGEKVIDFSQNKEMAYKALEQVGSKYAVYYQLVNGKEVYFIARY